MNSGEQVRPAGKEKMQDEKKDEQRKKLILNVIEGKWVEKPEEWVTHYRSKNYIAKITGVDSTYTLKREFLEKERVGHRTYFDINDFNIDDVFEIKCVYYSARWNPTVELFGFFKVVEKTETRIILIEISEEEVMKYIKEKFPESFQVKEATKEVEMLEKQKKENLEKLQALEKAREELTKDMPQLNVQELESVKKELIARIKVLAEQLKAFGGGKYISTDVKIKDYVEVKGIYVISRFEGKEVSLSSYLNAYLILVEEVKKCKTKVEEAKRVIGK